MYPDTVVRAREWRADWLLRRLETRALSSLVRNAFYRVIYGAKRATWPPLSLKYFRCRPIDTNLFPLSRIIFVGGERVSTANTFFMNHSAPSFRYYLPRDGIESSITLAFLLSAPLLSRRMFCNSAVCPRRYSLSLISPPTFSCRRCTYTRTRCSLPRQLSATRYN